MRLTTSYQLVAQAELGKVYNSNKAYIRLYAKYNSQSTANNSSNVSLQARVYSESTWYSGKTTTYRITGSGSIDSGNISYTTSASDMYPKNAERTLGTQTKDIAHNADGTRTIHGEVNFYSSPWGFNATASSGNTLELPSIPRKATVSDATNMNDETNPTVYFSNPGNMSLVPYINIYLNGAVALRLERSKGSYSSPYTWTITDAERQQIRTICKNVTSTTYTIGFDSYSGSTSTGYSSVERTLTIINATPVFENFEWETTNYQDLTGDNQTIIKGFSSIKTIISDANKALAKKEASIKSYQTVVGTKTKTNSTLTYPVETTVNNVDGVTVSVFANDSRGLSTKIEKPVSNFIDLLPLSITEMDVNRNPNNDEEVMLNVEGIIDTTNFGLLTNTIDRSRYYYKIKGTNDYIEGNTNLQFTYEQIQDNQYKFFVSQTIEGDIEEGFSSNGEYDIKVTISDKLTEVTKEKPLEQGSPAMAILGNCIALGAPYDENIGGRVQVMGTKLDDFVVESGTTGMWRYKKWSDGTAECFGRITITTTLDSAWGSLHTGANRIERQNYPFEFVEIPVEVVIGRASANACWAYSESDGRGLNTTTQTAIYNVARTGSAGSNTVHFDFYVVGKWK